MVGKLKDGLVGLFVGGDNTSGEEMSKNALTGMLVGGKLFGAKGAVGGGLAGAIFGSLGPEKTAELIDTVTGLLGDLGDVLGPLISRFVKFASDEIVPWLVEN